MRNWFFCDDIDAPEFGVCRNQDYWDEQEAAIRAWFREMPGSGAVYGEQVIFVKKDQRAMFLLRFGP